MFLRLGWLLVGFLAGGGEGGGASSFFFFSGGGGGGGGGWGGGCYLTIWHYVCICKSTIFQTIPIFSPVLTRLSNNNSGFFIQLLYDDSLLMMKGGCSWCMLCLLSNV